MWVFRTMIVSDDVVDTCRSLAMMLAGEGQKLWTTPLSPTGTEPATHWISSGLIDEQFADLLPLTETDYPGQPATLAGLSGCAVSEAQAAAIFTQCDVTLENPQQAMTRLGLQLAHFEESVNG